MHFSRLKSAFLATVMLASSLALLPAQNLNIDCGGYENYTASNGSVWVADRYFSGGQQLYTGYPVNGTPDSSLFRTARVGYYGGFSYAIPMKNGQYNVTLGFAEVGYWAAGQRVFNVSIDGNAVLSNFDVIAQGGYYSAIDRQFPVAVVDGTIRIDVQGVVGTGLLSAIQIAAVGQPDPATQSDTISLPASNSPVVTPPATPIVTPPAVAVPASGRDHFAAVNGSPNGDGSLGNPWDIATALSQPESVQPGDTIWLRGGTYGSGREVIHSYLLGTPSAPILVKQYPGERSVINGWLQIGCCDQDPHPNLGGYVWFWGLEFASSVTDRSGQPDGPPGYAQSAILDSVDTWAPGTKLINNIIHDTRLGPALWKEATGAEAYGNIVYNNGFQASDRGHGHGFYVQNGIGSSRMTVADNLSFNNFNMGMQFYGSDAALVRNLTVDGNILFNNGSISAGSALADNVIFAWSGGLSGIRLTNNFFYDPPQRDIGYNELGWSRSQHRPRRHG